jgi:predicted transcriptional regulator
LLPPIDEIKKRRIKLGLSQRKFASYLGVSQSTITKIERKKLNPSYELIRRAYDLLDSFKSSAIGLAGDICVRKVVSLEESDPISKAIEIMQQHGYKQLPIRARGSHHLFVGSVSERNISGRLVKVSSNPNSLLSKPISEVMDECFPMIAEDTPISLVIPLLQHFQAVLTTKKGRVSGIITNADLLKMMMEGSSPPSYHSFVQ